MRTKILSVCALIGMIITAMSTVSCNNSTNDTTVYYNTASTTTTLINSFKLAANSKILSNLDSIHFTIDQERLVIYNADSLPVGTDVTHLTTNINFASTVSRAQFHVTGGKVMSDSIFDYTSAAKDSIDFTGKVVLTITNYSGEISRSYTIKVNVHQIEPDTLYWNKEARRDLPATTAGTINAQRMVRQGEEGAFYSLLTQNGTTTISTAQDIEDTDWTVTCSSLPFTPITESFTATDNALFMLDQSHELMTSSDGGSTWNDCGITWYSIQGGYGDRVLGILQDGATFKHDEYPRTDGFEPKAIESDFPLNASSQLVIASNSWTTNRQAMLMGGVKNDASLSSDVWGYDGEKWGKISIYNTYWSLPELKGATLFPYYTFDVNSGNLRASKFVTWVIMGGTLADGSLNTTVYTSRDQGLRWSVADQSLQLPDYIPAFTEAQAFIINKTITASKQAKSGLRLLIAQQPTQWDCPYIYLVGGKNKNEAVLNNIWQGVINRLKYREIQ